MTTTEELINARDALALARRNKRLLDDKLDNLLEQLHGTPEWRDYSALKQASGIAGTEVKNTELAVREVAVRLYEETKAVSPVDGVSVYQSGDVEITDEPVLMRWLADYALYALSVNKTELKKLVNGKGVPGAKAVKVPKARIARDLSEFEPGDEPDSV